MPLAKENEAEQGFLGSGSGLLRSPVAGPVLPSLDMDHRTFSCLRKAYVPMLGAERKHAGKERGGRTAPPRDGQTLKHVLKEQSHIFLVTFTITLVYTLNENILVLF